MFKHLSLSCLLLVAVSSTVFAASSKGEKVGKIRDPHDPAFINSGSCPDDDVWTKNALVNENFRAKDCFKTGPEGSIFLELKDDNNTFTIGENSIVDISEYLVKDPEKGTFVIKSNIKKGYMGFKVNREEGHEASFRTGTAAASIRGTEGALGGNEHSFFGGLKNGRLHIESHEGRTLDIVAGETVIGRGEFVSLKLKSSGDLGFAKILNTLISDTTLSLEDLTAAAVKADSAYQESLAANATSAAAQTAEVAQEKEDLKVPQVKYSSYDSLRCVANVSVSDVQKGTEARLSALMDGTPISEVSVKRNMPKRVNLRSGVHEYEFVVENDSGRNSVKKTLGCYPMKPFSVKVFGKKTETIQIPPAPPGVDDVIMQTLQFQIRLPEYDPSLLNKVTVRQDGKVILQERLSQIQNLDYQIPVELKRGHKNRFDIEVVHKSGFAVKTTKFYKVGE